jgi:hypothetical protein
LYKAYKPKPFEYFYTLFLFRQYLEIFESCPVKETKIIDPNNFSPLVDDYWKTFIELLVSGTALESAVEYYFFVYALKFEEWSKFSSAEELFESLEDVPEILVKILDIDEGFGTFTLQ